MQFKTQWSMACLKMSEKVQSLWSRLFSMHLNYIWRDNSYVFFRSGIYRNETIKNFLYPVLFSLSWNKEFELSEKRGKGGMVTRIWFDMTSSFPKTPTISSLVCERRIYKHEIQKCFKCVITITLSLFSPGKCYQRHYRTRPRFKMSFFLFLLS